jgi:hypothetical protein
LITEQHGERGAIAGAISASTLPLGSCASSHDVSAKQEQSNRRHHHSGLLDGLNGALAWQFARWPIGDGDIEFPMG